MNRLQSNQALLTDALGSQLGSRPRLVVPEASIQRRQINLVVEQMVKRMLEGARQQLTS